MSNSKKKPPKMTWKFHLFDHDIEEYNDNISQSRASYAIDFHTTKSAFSGKKKKEDKNYTMAVLERNPLPNFVN